MTATEKRYGQTEKDALVVHWAKERFNIHLLRVPKVKINTAPTVQQDNRATPTRNRDMGLRNAGC